MSKFIDEIKAEVEESNMRLSFQDNEVFACDVIDRLIERIEKMEHPPRHSDKCGCI